MTDTQANLIEAKLADEIASIVKICDVQKSIIALNAACQIDGNPTPDDIPTLDDLTDLINQRLAMLPALRDILTAQAARRLN